MTIDQYFQTLTGFPPRQFQQQAIAHLLNRQDVLSVPTGSGKIANYLKRSRFFFSSP